MPASARVDWRVVAGGTAAAAALSAAFLPWQAALLSTLLAALMTAGAESDARAFLLPDAVTFGALAGGLAAAALLDPLAPGQAVAAAALRGAATAGALALVRAAHWRLAGREGLGRGDVKLAAAVGAWLPAELIPVCFALATGAALAFVLARRRPIRRTTRIPLGAFLCPALWLVFFASVL